MSLIADATPQPGNKFTIVSISSVVGTFNGLPDGSKVTINGVELTVRYTATTVTLSAGRGPEDVIALGAEAGAKPRVKVIDSQTGEVIVSFLAYSGTFRGGVRVAVADMNGDGQAEIIVAPGAGMSSQVRVFDLTGHELTDFRTTAYAGFSGGVFVAAGDVNGDGRVDLITTPGSGMSAQVKVFKNRVGIPSTNPDPLSNSPIYTFNAFGATFKGGATVAAGDITGDGRADIVVGNGPGMSPHVRVFDTSLIDPPPPTGKITLGPFLYQIAPFNSTDRGGVFVAAGDVRGDSRAEIIIGNGVAGRSRVEMYELRRFAVQKLHSLHLQSKAKLPGARGHEKRRPRNVRRNPHWPGPAKQHAAELLQSRWHAERQHVRTRGRLPLRVLRGVSDYRRFSELRS